MEKREKKRISGAFLASIMIHVGVLLYFVHMMSIMQSSPNTGVITANLVDLTSSTESSSSTNSASSTATISAPVENIKETPIVNKIVTPPSKTKMSKAVTKQSVLTTTTSKRVVASKVATSSSTSQSMPKLVGTTQVNDLVTKMLNEKQQAGGNGLGASTTTSGVPQGMVQGGGGPNMQVIGGGTAIWDSQNKLPLYPKAELSQSQQGSTLLLMTVDNQGQVKNAIVIKSSGFTGLDNATLKASEKWKVYIQKNGIYTGGKVKITISFKLKNGS